MRIIIVGPPGSGKTTFGKMLSEHFKIDFISTGNLLREKAKEDEKLREIIESGKLVDAETVNKIVKEALKDKKSFVLEGFPRKIEESEFLLKEIQFDLILYLDVDKEVIIERLKNRYFCPKCFRVYNHLTQKPKNDLICDYCNVKLEQREEDKEEKIKIRFEEFEKETLPSLQYLKEKVPEKFVEVKLIHNDIKKDFEEILAALSFFKP